MIVGRQSPLSPPGRRAGGHRAFTLVELIVVMVLLLTVASLVAPRMASFFKGRALSGEAQRVLSLLHYARSQATAEAVPVMVWFDPVRSTYGVEPAPGFSGFGEVRRLEFTLEPSLRLEVKLAGEEVVSEQDDERLGLSVDRPAIRFNPDGFPDLAAPPRVVLRQDDGGALELALTANRLGYEIRTPDARP
jgi:prepilin-type N-terminal cleavage/methylation domain-containing protein